MNLTVGIRLEDKNQWERRTTLVPGDVASLVTGGGLDIVVQKSPIRAFSEAEYHKAGAVIRDHLKGVPIVVGVKEMGQDTFEEGRVYVFFSHTIKGQAYNMPMLQRLIDLKCTLIDYERIADEKGRRLVFFGKWAGTAGMIDSLWALGRRFEWEGKRTPLSTIKQTLHYQSLEDAREAIETAGKKIRSNGVPAALAPDVCAFLGYGNVSRGAQEIWDLLPSEEIAPSELGNLARAAQPPNDRVFKVVFKEEDLVRPKDPDEAFDLTTYYQEPNRFRSVFSTCLSYLTVVMNCVYWEKKYPRFITQDSLGLLFTLQERPRLRVIGDITCDIEGAVEVNVRSTDPGNPVYVYDPLTGRATNGVEGRGVIVLAVDNLPCELPREASAEFSHSFHRLVPAIAKADYSRSFDRLDLPDEIKKAVIVHRGVLTPPYSYLSNHL